MVLGVALAVVFEQNWLDPLVAMLVALHILREGGRILHKAINGLMDNALPAERVAQLSEMLATIGGPQVQFTNIRTRAAAAQAFAQADLLVPGHWSVERAHQLADQAEQQLAALGIQLIVHIEPHP